MIWKALFLIVILVTLMSENRVECKCAYKPCGDDPHTMCRYPPKLDKSVQKCSGAKAKAGLKNDLKKAILNTHNQLRQQVAQGKAKGQPPAANMMKLHWNTELETIAQRFVNSCPDVGHDTCRNMKDGSYVGQNSASNAFSVKKPNRTEAVEASCNMWYNEIEHMDGNYVEDFSKLDYTKVGHYTQLVWAETDALGCGYVEYTPDENFQYILLDCNYNPGGNMAGENSHVYVKGEACSKCPKGARCSKRYPGLCTKEKDENKDIPTHKPKKKKKGEGISVHGTPWSLLALVCLICFINAL